MSYSLTKTLLAALLIAAGLTATFSMLTLMGRSERRLGTTTLKKTHRVAGYVFAALLAVLAGMGLRHLASEGDSLHLRGVLHWVLASLLVFLLLLKITISRFFKQFLRYLPAMGMTVITLTLLVATLSAVFVVITGEIARDDAGHEGHHVASSPVVEEKGSTAAEAAGGPYAGERLFDRYCAGCHYADSVNRKAGPGLAGLFNREALPVRGVPVTDESVKEQLLTPVGRMPSFKGSLSDEQIDDVVAYLRTL